MKEDPEITGEGTIWTVLVHLYRPVSLSEEFVGEKGKKRVSSFLDMTRQSYKTPN